jgi:tetratricopeptide (TPR) repeat protein
VLRAIIIGTLAVASASGAGSEACAGCHREIAETYRKTGMGRSFYKPSSHETVENSTYYHKASDSYFTMLRRDGGLYQQRYQLDAGGKRINEMEKRVDYIMGSGNHSRAYLSRTPQNKLVELPLAWYSEKGGYWAMNPGYDRPDHQGFRREITYDCMFCHNAYPEIPAGHEQPFAEPVYTAAMPSGIDCSRCHGDGAQHVRTAGRAAILNPKRLTPDRQMEVCMQCHLETTSFPLPNSIQRYERGPFSYRPNEPLADFILTFDHARGKGYDEKYEIVNSAYRLRRSQCFLQSKGKMTCTTCHNPHDVRSVGAATCRTCHAAAFQQLVATGKHTTEDGCIDCHMPKRRTEDVVHVTMTDHYIQRRKPAGDLLADRPETEGTPYRGEVVPYYPATLPKTAESDLYLAIAQVIQKSNLTAGIAQLKAAIERYRPKRPEYYLQLAEAWREQGPLANALPYYEQAVRLDPKFVFGLQKLGTALRRSNRSAEAVEYLKRAAAVAPENAVTWRELGLAYSAQQKMTDAAAALQKAVALDADMSEAHNNLGVVWAQVGDTTRADAAFREAIRIQPDYADAHGNLGNLLSEAGRLDEARSHLEISLRLRPNDAPTRYNYAMVLGRTRDIDGAQRELEAAVRADPDFADAHLLLGTILLEKGQAEAALPHLRKAAADKNPSVREEAERMLRKLGK